MRRKRITIHLNDLKYLYISNLREEEKSVESINISEFYASIVEAGVDDATINNEFANYQERQKYIETFVDKIQNKKSIGKLKDLPMYLKKQTAGNAKYNLDKFADNISKYRGKYNNSPEKLDLEVLINLYTSVIDLYMEEKDRELTFDQISGYKELVATNKGIETALLEEK